MNTNDIRFQKLTPDKEVDLGVYEKAIEFAFSNDDIQNIALSGAYGSGKSSILETYISKHSNRSFLHVSMAHFPEGEEELGDNRKLQGKIINQLVHLIEEKKIPQTNFRIKRTECDTVDIHKLIMGIVGLFMFLLLVFHNGWNDIITGLHFRFLQQLLLFSTTSEMRLCALLYCVIFTIYTIILLAHKFVGKRVLKKVNLKHENIDIELFSEDTEECFDRYLDEVLYLLENSGVDAVVFEDLDRFPNNGIFEKLREINILLNRKNIKVIRFFYLLRDDVFLSKDRTKFFDFIIPVVPVIDGSNSFNKLIDYFDSSNLEKRPTKDFLRKISLYIDDMRILKNIYNEYVVYYSELQKNPTGQDENRLFAMITYKNLFPKDFSDLQLARGYVYAIFAKKAEICERDIEALQEEISRYENEIKSISREYLKSIDELEALYYVGSKNYYVNGKHCSEYENLTELVIAIKNNDYKVGSSVYNTSNIDLTGTFDEIRKKPGYIERKESIELVNNGKMLRLQQKVEELNDKINWYKQAYLKDLIIKQNESFIFYASEVNIEIKKNPYFPLIKFLLTDGYIDETYPDYMTYFYENGISRQDKLFIRSITDRKPLSANFVLTNPKMVIESMRDVDFKAEESLNYYLLDALLDNMSYYKKQLEEFRENLLRREGVGFFENYIDRKEHIREFVRWINKNPMDGVVEWILDEEFSELSYNTQKKYVQATLTYCDDNIVEWCNENEKLTDFVNDCEDFFALADYEEGDIEALVERMVMAGIDMQACHIEKTPEKVMDVIYQQCAFAVTKPVLLYFAETKLCIPKEEANRAFLTRVMEQDSLLSKVIQNSLNEVVSAFVQSEEPIYDTESIILMIINNKDIEKTVKEKYLSLVSEKISKLEEIEDNSLWENVLPDKVIPSEENIYHYYFTYSGMIDKTLVAYLNNFDEKTADINPANLDERYGEGSKNKLYLDIRKCNDIANNLYKIFVRAFHYYSTNFSEQGISNDKMRILIEDNLIRMTLINLQTMRTAYPSLLMEFIEKHVEEYANLITKEVFVEEELPEVLEMTLPDAEKIRLISYANNPHSIVDKSYSDEVMMALMEQASDDFEEDKIYNWYAPNRPRIRREICNKAIRRIKVIIQTEMSLHYELLLDLLRAEGPSIEDKKELLANMAKEIEGYQMIECLSFLQLPKFVGLFDGKRPHLKVTDANKNLLNAFKSRGWISKYDEKDNAEETFYVAIGKKYSRKNDIV